MENVHTQFLEVTLHYDASRPYVGRLVGRAVIIDLMGG